MTRAEQEQASLVCDGCGAMRPFDCTCPERSSGSLRALAGAHLDRGLTPRPLLGLAHDDWLHEWWPLIVPRAWRRDFERAPCVCAGRGYVVVPVVGGFIMTACARCANEVRCEHSGAVIPP